MVRQKSLFHLCDCLCKAYWFIARFGLAQAWNVESPDSKGEKGPLAKKRLLATPPRQPDFDSASASDEGSPSRKRYRRTITRPREPEEKEEKVKNRHPHRPYIDARQLSNYRISFPTYKTPPQIRRARILKVNILKKTFVPLYKTQSKVSQKSRIENAHNN